MTIYCETLAKDICKRIAEGFSVAVICQAPDMPHETTIYGWLIDRPDFLAMYDIAKEKQMEIYANQLIDLADNCRADADAVAKAKLQIFARQWVMGRLKPKKYGDKTTIAGDRDNPLIMTLAATLDSRIASRQAQKAIEHAPPPLSLPVLDAESVEIE